jgi:RimJ/RimL family protein N-acetyltransferase
MRLNYTTAILGESLQLVPYRKKFVPNYHVWMQSPFLLDMTGSEPLSIEEEYEMQQSWRDDDKKCTFILLSRSSTSPETERMVGDVNLFLSQDDNDTSQAEIDVMIAEESYRGKGMGTEAVMLMMIYGMNFLHIHKFFAKIKEENTASIELFKRYIRWKMSDTFSPLTFSSFYSD